MEENEEETAERVVTYMALETMLRKHEKILNNAIQEDNVDGYLDEYIAMQEEIIGILKKQMEKLNNG